MKKKSLDLPFVRRHFPLIGNGWAYFENAGGSYVPTSVMDRMDAFLGESQMQPYGLSEPSRLATRRLEGAKRLMAQMINATTDEIVIGPSTTLNVFVLAQALRTLFEAGGEIIVTNQDHEANSGAWRRLDEFGFVIREWRIDPETGDLNLSDLDVLLNEKTCLVCFPHCSNVVATINPVADITAKAHAVGALVCVDAVAYAAHARMDVQALDADFYLFSLYKIYGPHLALMYAKREHLERMKNQNHFFYDDTIPKKLNPGGHNYESVASLEGIIDYFEAVYMHHFDNGSNDLFTRLGPVFDLFAEQEEACANRLADYLVAKPEVRLIGRQTGDRQQRMPTFAFTVAGRTSADIVAGITAHKIAAGHGHFYGYRCVEALGIEDPDDGVVRTSMVHYNTLDEVDQLIAALEAVI